MELQDTFYITLSAGTVIYRAFTDKNKSKGNWYSYDIENVKGYSNKIGKFIIKKDVKLVNITSGFFHIHYIDKLNLLYTGNNYDGIDDRKFLAMVPIGLPNIESQFDYLKHIGIISSGSQIHNPSVPKIHLDTFYDKSRISQYELDKFFTDAMTTIYKNSSDGFTLPFRTFNRIFNGYFLREIYFYDVDYIELLETFTLDNTQTGGNNGELLSNMNNILNKPQPKYLRPSDLGIKFGKIQIKDYSDEVNKYPIILADRYEDHNINTDEEHNKIIDVVVKNNKNKKHRITRRRLRSF